MESALNGQITEESFSAYLYLSMSTWFHIHNLPGFARWMEIQAQEEYAHAMKFYHFILERGGTPKLATLKEPESEWKSPEDIFEAAYKHEQHITSCINDLVDLAIAEKDHATNAMLQWFVSEQVEEEASASEVLERVKLAGTSGGGLFMLDRELGQRTFTPPSAE
jgi:ferritin